MRSPKWRQPSFLPYIFWEERYEEHFKKYKEDFFSKICPITVFNLCFLILSAVFWEFCFFRNPIDGWKQILKCPTVFFAESIICFAEQNLGGGGLPFLREFTFWFIRSFARWLQFSCCGLELVLGVRLLPGFFSFSASLWICIYFVLVWFFIFCVLVSVFIFESILSVLLSPLGLCSSSILHIIPLEPNHKFCSGSSRCVFL